MKIQTESMTITWGEDLTELIIKGHNSPYCFSESGIHFLRMLPQYLSEIATTEEEYDKLFLELRKKVSKFLYDDVEIQDIITKALHDYFAVGNLYQSERHF